MNKKILLVSALALGCLSSAALANGSIAAAPIATAVVTSDFTPNIYVGLQGGYADSGMKASDLNSDLYVLDDEGNIIHPSENIKINDDTGFAGRVFMGYDFHKYFAIEAGYFLYGPKTEFKWSDTGNKIGDVTTQAFDLVGVIKAPIMDNLGIYAKAGPGYLMQKYSYENGGGDDNVNKFDLVYGFGMYYNLTDNWTIDAAFTRYNSGHTQIDKDWQSNVDFYSLGIRYKFNLPA